MRSLASVTVAATICLATAASSATGAFLIYGRNPGLVVNPVDAGRFEVIEDHGAGAQDIWCAAASYAEDVLGITRGRLYVETPRGPARTVPGRKGVIFTTERTPNAFTSVSVSVREAGMNLPIFHALQFCRNHILELDD